MERLEPKNPSILRTGFEISSEHRKNQRNPLEELALKKEKSAIHKSLQETAGKLSSSLEFTDEESCGKWDRFGERATLIAKAGGTLTEKIANSPLKGTVIANNTAFILGLAEIFLIEDTFEKREKLAKKYKFFKSYEPFRKICLFALCGEVFIKIHSMTTSEIIEQNHQISPSDYFKWHMEANLIRNPLLDAENKRALEEAFLKNNDNALAIVYPNETRAKIDECCGQIISLTSMTPEYFDRVLKRLFPNTSGVEEEIKQKARKIVEKTSALSQKIFNTILTPYSPKFPSLKDVLEDYLNSNLSEKTIALLILGLNTATKVVKAYRTARKFALRSETYSLFYEQFGNCMKDYLEQLPQGTETDADIFTKDDVIVFLNDESQQNNPATFADLKTIINNETFKKCVKQKSFVHPQEIENWQGVLKPKAVLIKLSEGNPSEFKITFSYESEEGEKQDFSVTFNPWREKIDWNFLEDPNDPEMQEMKNAVMLSIKSVFLNVQRQTESVTQGKQKEEIKTESPLPPENNTKKPIEKIRVPRGKTEKKELPKPLTPIQEVLEGYYHPPIENGIKKHIAFPKDIAIAELMGNISSEDQRKILKRIQEFNDGGVGKFKALSTMKHDGKTVYELKVGNFRVLSTETTSENGNESKETDEKVHKFEVYKIGNRRDIFRKKH